MRTKKWEDLNGVAAVRTEKWAYFNRVPTMRNGKMVKILQRYSCKKLFIIHFSRSSFIIGTWVKELAFIRPHHDYCSLSKFLHRFFKENQSSVKENIIKIKLNINLFIYKFLCGNHSVLLNIDRDRQNLLSFL